MKLSFKPYLGQAYRSEKAGVYVYADNDVKRSSLELAGAYIDIILSNETDNIGAEDRRWHGKDESRRTDYRLRPSRVPAAGSSIRI